MENSQTGHETNLVTNGQPDVLLIMKVHHLGVARYRNVQGSKILREGRSSSRSTFSAMPL